MMWNLGLRIMPSYLQRGLLSLGLVVFPLLLEIIHFLLTPNPDDSKNPRICLFWEHQKLSDPLWWWCQQSRLFSPSSWIMPTQVLSPCRQQAFIPVHVQMLHPICVQTWQVKSQTNVMWCVAGVNQCQSTSIEKQKEYILLPSLFRTNNKFFFSFSFLFHS